MVPILGFSWFLTENQARKVRCGPAVSQVSACILLYLRNNCAVTIDVARAGFEWPESLQT